MLDHVEATNEIQIVEIRGDRSVAQSFTECRQIGDFDDFVSFDDYFDGLKLSFLHIATQLTNHDMIVVVKTESILFFDVRRQITIFKC